MGRILSAKLDVYEEVLNMQAFSSFSLVMPKRGDIEEGDLFSYPTRNLPVYLLVVRDRGGYFDVVSVTNQVELCPMDSVLFSFVHPERDVWASLNQFLFTVKEPFLRQLNYEGSIDKEELVVVKRGVFEGQIPENRRGYDTPESKRFIEIEKSRIASIIEEGLLFFEEDEEIEPVILIHPVVERLRQDAVTILAAASDVNVIEKDFGTIVKGDNEAVIMFKDNYKNKIGELRIGNVVIYYGILKALEIKNLPEDLFAYLSKLEVRLVDNRRNS